MDRKTIEELMRDADYMYGASQNLQNVPLTESNINSLHDIQQLTKKIFFELKKELDNLSEIDKTEEKETVEEAAEEQTEDVSEDA